MCRVFIDQDMSRKAPRWCISLLVAQIEIELTISEACYVIGENSLKMKREKSTSTKGHYVTNGQLLPAVLAAKAAGKVSNELIAMIWKIAERYSHKHNFVGYSYREDMVAAAVMNLCNNALKFNPEKSSNPFSFYTTAIYHSFLQYMADEKKHRSIRDALLVDGGANPSFGYAERDKDEHDFAMRDDTGAVIGVPEIETAPTGIELLDAIAANRPQGQMSLRGKSRMPSDIKVYKPSDISVDPVTGAIVINEDAVPTMVVAKPPAPRVVKKPGRGRPPKKVDPSASIPPKVEKVKKAAKAPAVKKEKPAKVATKKASKKAS
jgi:hypothetical protein